MNPLYNTVHIRHVKIDFFWSDPSHRVFKGGNRYSSNFSFSKICLYVVEWHILSRAKCKHPHLITLVADTTTAEGVRALKRTLREFDRKCKETDIHIHPDKTVKIVIGKSKCKTEDFDFQLAGKVIREENSARDLGVIYNNKLSNSHHFQKLIGKIQSRSMMVKKRIWNRDIKFLSMLWNALCSSLIIFGLNSWGRPSRDQLQKLQGMQRRFFEKARKCQHCLGQKLKRKRGDLSECKLHTGPDPIDKLILKTELKTFFAIKSGKLRINGDLCAPETRSEEEKRPSERYKPKKLPGTSAFMAKSFASRTISVWNALPNEVRNWHISEARFKRGLNHKVPWLKKEDTFRIDNYNWSDCYRRLERYNNNQCFDFYCRTVR